MELYAYEREHLKKLRKYLAECTVLLKTNGDFPLEAPGKLALYHIFFIYNKKHRKKR